MIICTTKVPLRNLLEKVAKHSPTNPHLQMVLNKQIYGLNLLINVNIFPPGPTRERLKNPHTYFGSAKRKSGSKPIQVFYKHINLPTMSKTYSLATVLLAMK